MYGSLALMAVSHGLADTFREGVCPAEGVTVYYAPVFRRDTSSLLTNVVPAFVVGAKTSPMVWYCAGLDPLS